MFGRGVSKFLSVHRRAFVFVFLAVLVGTFALYVMTRPFVQDDTVYISVASAFFSGVVVAFLVAALLQTGIILNSESQHAFTMEALTERIETSKKDIETVVEESRKIALGDIKVKIHANTIDDISNKIYGSQLEIESSIRSSKDVMVREIGAKIDARYTWGLEGVDESFDEGRLLEGVKSSKIKWLNAKFNSADIQIEVIRRAVSRGCNVKLLLMHPESEMANYRGRYTSEEYRNEDELHEDVKNYVSGMRVNARKMLTEYRRMEDIYPDEGSEFGDMTVSPGFRLRFYMDAPGLPMLLRRSEHHKAGYTGFYLNSFSRLMPYLSWYGPGNEKSKMVDNLFDYFDRKWFFAETWDAKDLAEDAFVESNV